MKRLASVGLAICLLAAGGCAGDDGDDAQPVFASAVQSGSIGLSGTQSGVQMSGDAIPGILVTGTGEVRGRPDTLTLSLGVTVTRKTVSEATADAATAADKVLGALAGSGVAKDDTQTRDYSIYPQYSPQTSADAPPRITGYTVSNVVGVKIRDLAKAGAVIDAAAAAGGDEVIVQGVAFTLEDSTALLGQARERAWQDAKAKAGELARLAGVPLGAAIQISETTSGGSPPTIASGEAARASTPIEPGLVTTSVVITVRFALGS